jgi:hypothetical protein
MRPAKEARWRDVSAASSIRADVESVAIEETTEVTVVGGALTGDTDGERSQRQRQRQR